MRRLEIFELDTALELADADILKVLAADDALEGGAVGERALLDNFELVGESDALEGGAVFAHVVAHYGPIAAASVDDDGREARALTKGDLTDCGELVFDDDAGDFGILAEGLRFIEKMC